MTMRLLSLSVLLCIGPLLSTADAMNRWDALSMLESGNDDQAIGTRGEISRYQIRPYLWPGGNPVNASVALKAAHKIMQPRVARFEETHNRPPTDFEFYVLWNAPQEVNHPCKAVAARARRFVNLVQRPSVNLASRQAF